jgi:hypothetical protein
MLGMPGIVKIRWSYYIGLRKKQTVSKWRKRWELLKKFWKTPEIFDCEFCEGNGGGFYDGTSCPVCGKFDPDR